VDVCVGYHVALTDNRAALVGDASAGAKKAYVAKVDQE